MSNLVTSGLVTIASLICASQACAGGDDEKAKVSWVECSPSELQLVNTDRRLRLNGFAEIAATGKCAGAIQNSKDKDALKLQLSGVFIPALPVTRRLGKCPATSSEATTISSGCDTVTSSRVILTFVLKRDTSETENRRAWTTFIEKVGNRGQIGSVAVALGDSPAVEATISSDVEFRVALGDRGPAMLLAVALLFCFAWGYLLKFGGLYDRRDVTQPALPGGVTPAQSAATYSLARVQMAFWGLVVALSFLGIYWTTGTMEVINPQVLVLLGISAATGLGSVLIGGTKAEVAVRTVRDSDQTPTRKYHFLRDILSDGDGNVSVHRFQSILWTLVLGCVFIYTVISTLTMPEFSVTLLTLMGISNGTYLGFKYSDKP